MKIKKFFVALATLCLFLTGCSSSFNWDKSVTKLEDAGYVVTRNYTEQADLDRITNEINAEFKMHEKDYTVEVVKYMSLDKDEEVGCVFLQFKAEEQAKSYYDLRIEIRSKFEGSKLKLHLADDVIVFANATEVVDLLNLKFN